MKTIIFLVFLFIGQISFAQTGEGELYIALKKADKELDIVYNKLKNKVGGKDRAALIASQQAWLKYRDLHCKFSSKSESDGSVFSNKMKLDCIRFKTYERIKELEEEAADY